MAEITAIADEIASVIASALYPDGETESVVGAPVKLYPGWPNATDLDADMRLGTCHVTVYPTQAGGKAEQVFEREQPAAPPVHGISATVSGSSITFSGIPTSGEYVSLIVEGRKAYSRVGATLGAILTALLADILPDFPGSTLVGSVLTVNGAFEFTVRSGAPVQMVKPVWRHEQGFQISVWAPNPELRSAIGQAVNVALATTSRLALDDCSYANISLGKSIDSDSREAGLIYRRDVMTMIQFATVETFTAYEVTVVATTFQGVDSLSGMADGPPVTTLN